MSTSSGTSAAVTDESPEPRTRYDSLFRVYAAWTRRQGRWQRRESPLDWRLLRRQAEVESGLDPDAVSPVGAKGLTQFMDATWNEWQQRAWGDAGAPPRRWVSPFDPEDAIHAQADVMAWLLRVWQGEVRLALASYNAGIGRVRAAVERFGPQWLEHLPRETRDYVARILEGLG